MLNDTAATLARCGYAVSADEVRSRGPLEPWLAAYAGLSAVAALLVYPLPLLAALAGTVAIVLHARESDGRPVFRHWSVPATSVVARAPAATRPQLVIVARLVASPARFPERTTRALGFSLQALMVAVAAAGAGAWIAEVEADLPRWVGGAGAALAVAIAVAALILYRPPAPDDASRSPALETLVALAPLLKDRPVWLVAAGALDGLPVHEAAGAAWLNLEGGPPGAVVAVSEEGTWRERRADRWLLGAAEEAGAAVRPYRAAPTNATSLLARRRRALTLLVGGSRDDVRVAAAVANGVTAS